MRCVTYHDGVKASPFDERAFFAAIASSGVRALLIGRRALIALGMPVMTSDYDFRIAADDAARPGNLN